MNPQPKPIKRRTAKAKKDKQANANIADVRAQVMEREDGRCRVTALLHHFGFCWMVYGVCDLHLAHLDGRGMGGNKDGSRDTTANTIAIKGQLHNGWSRSMHTGHLKIRPLTDRGADGPCCVEFYEQLPSEVRK